MPNLHDQVSAQYSAFERRGRGWKVYDDPVVPIPPFEPFRGYRLQKANPDDGRVPSLGSGLVESVLSFFGSKRPLPVEQPAIYVPEDPIPEPLERNELLTELQTVLPANLDVRPDAFITFLTQLAVCSDPIAFELLGNSDRIVSQFTVSPRDTAIVRRQLSAYFPDVAFIPRQETLLIDWFDTGPKHAVVDFGLEQECIRPLINGSRLDPFVGLIGAMSELAREEMAVFQVIFQPTFDDWPSSLIRAATEDGKPLFKNRGDILTNTRTKVASPLFGTVVRVASRGATFERAWAIVKELAFSLRVFSSREGNTLVPLNSRGYHPSDHGMDVRKRQTRRSAMLLNLSELMGLVHFPSPIVRSPKLRRHVERTKAAPQVVRGQTGVVLGINSHVAEEVTVRLNADQRVRHTHVIGATATGKSTLLFNMIRQDIEAGEGVGVLDPHGDLIERILGVIPKERINDVIVVDPSDEEYSVGFNILSAHSDWEKNLLASDLVSVFQRLSTSWGDQMGSVLNNAILAFLESSRGGTIADLRRFLLEPNFRERFLETVSDPDIAYYWRKGFSQLSGNKSIGPVLTRLDTFLAPKPIRYMVSQPANRLDFADILDTGKIFLARLSQGQMGKENSFLLGSLLMAKFQQAAMARQRQDSQARKDFWLYVDEFHNFITPSIAEILSGARKYRLGLILAHQELRQLERDREVASAVLSNPYTRIVLRVGDDDARKLADGFSYFDSRDLQNLETGRAVCRVEKADGDFNLQIPAGKDPSKEEAAESSRSVVAASRQRYATSRAEIAAALERKAREESEAPSAPSPAPKRGKSSVEPNPSVSQIFESAEGPVEMDAEVDAGVAEGASESVSSSIADAKSAQSETSDQKPEADSPKLGLKKHAALKRDLIIQAEGLGYLVTEEEPVPNSQGRADLVFRRGKRVIACEVSVETNADEEIRNLRKCLGGGFPLIVLLTTSRAKLANIEAKFRPQVTPDESARVLFFTPSGFVEKLAQWASIDTPEDIAASKLPQKRSDISMSHDLTEAERQALERKMLEDLARAMKLNPPPSSDL